MIISAGVCFKPTVATNQLNFQEFPADVPMYSIVVVFNSVKSPDVHAVSYTILPYICFWQGYIFI